MTAIPRLSNLVVALVLVVVLAPLAANPTPYHAQALAPAGASPLSPADEPNCASPPAGFNPLTASDRELSSYGLPQRPAGDASATAAWRDAVTHAKHRSCRYDSRPAGVGRHASLGSDFNPTWAGYQVYNTTYTNVQGYWNAPCVSGWNTQNPIGDWVGLGGNPGHALFQGGTFINSEYKQPGGSSTNPTPFWEYVDANGHGTINTWSTFAAVYCGDQMYTQVDYGHICPGQSYAFVEDITANHYANSLCQSSAPDTSTAEWIDERLEICLGGYTQLLQFNPAISWTYAQAGTTGNYQPIAYWPYNVEHMSESSYDHLALTSGLGADGESFSDTWWDPGTYNCP